MARCSYSRHPLVRAVGLVVAVTCLLVGVLGGAPAVGVRAAPALRADGTIAWSDPAEGVTFVRGWRAAACGAEVPLICVQRRGHPVGVVDVGASPLATYDNAALAETAPQRFLRRQARAFYRLIAADRAEGCAPDYVVDTEPVLTRRAMGARGVQYGFRGGFAGAELTEWIRIRLVIVGEDVVYFTASAHDADGCIGTDGNVFTTQALGLFGARWGVLARRTPPPTFLLSA